MKKKILEVAKLIGRGLKGKIRYIILIILFLVLYFGWRYLEENVLVSIPEEVVGYCTEKYGGEFEWVEFDLEDSGTMSKMSVVTDGVVEFHVNRYYTNSGKLYYSDDYLSHKYESDLIEYINARLPEGSRGTVLVEETTLGEVEGGSISVGDLLSGEDVTLVIRVYSPSKWTLEDAEEFSSRFPCTLSVFLNVGGVESHFITDEGVTVFR